MTAMPTTSAPRAPHQPPTTGARTGGHHHGWRWVAGVLAVLLAVLLAVFVSAAWYFSGRIESGALRSSPAPDVPAFDDVEVVAVANFPATWQPGDALMGSVTLAEAADAPYDFDAPAEYSLLWAGAGDDPPSWGVVGPATKNPDGTVTRSLTVASGAPPRAGQLAAQNRSLWPLGPNGGMASMWIEKSDVMVGQDPAWYFPAREAGADTTAIVVHGQNGNRSNGMRFVGPAYTAGMSTLVITYRNDLGAPADPSGRLQYGRTEWRDLDAAVTWARQHGATHVVLIGESMGGAVVAAFLENSDQAGVVSRVVLDAPMLSLAESIRWNARDAVPVVGGAVPAPVLWGAEQLTSLRYGVDWAAVDYLDDTSWLRVPALVLHGTGDERVPVTVARSLEAAAPNLVTLREFPGAQHTEAMNWDPASFQHALDVFLADR